MPESSSFTIALVAGARPNFMKVAPVYHALADRIADLLLKKA